MWLAISPVGHGCSLWGGNPCKPACDGRYCGDDGCGGSCGECLNGSICLDDGTCCFVTCDGRECGDDRCGGTCGAGCSGEDICHAGTCVNYPRKFPGPCRYWEDDFRRDVTGDPTCDYEERYTYNDQESLIEWTIDLNCDGFWETRYAYTYYPDGLRHTFESYDYYLGLYQRVTYTYYPDDQLETEVLEQLDDDPPWTSTKKYTYDALGRKIRVDAYKDNKPDPGLIWTYEYYPDSDKLHVESVYDGNGELDQQYTYSYTDRTTTIDYNWMWTSFPIDFREIKTYNEAGQLVFDDFDHGDRGPDGTIDRRKEFTYEFGCLVRYQNWTNQVVDFSIDYTNDGHCNFLTNWRRIGSTEKGYEIIGIYDYSCWQ